MEFNAFTEDDRPDKTVDCIERQIWRKQNYKN